MKKITVLTSDGDSPGVNATVGAVIRTAIYNETEAYGVYHGYQGLLNDGIHKPELGSVGDAIQRGGIFLYSARCPEFKGQEVRKVAVENLHKRRIEGLVVIGGDGSYRGAQRTSEECKEIRVIDISGTIDNDINSTNFTIGLDTALNTVIGLVDKIRDTASGHARIFIIRAMSHGCGDLTLWAGLSVGAETTVVPEVKTDIKETADKIEQGIKRGRERSIVLVTEDCMTAQDYQRELSQYIDVDNRVSMLGHVRRGGGPAGADRVLASRLGGYAVDLLMRGETVKGVGIKNNKIVVTPFDEIFDGKNHKFDYSLYELANKLST